MQMAEIYFQTSLQKEQAIVRLHESRGSVSGLETGMADIMIANPSGWRCAQGTHPFPSRTRWLRPERPMVLCWRRHGRAGGCRIKKRKWCMRKSLAKPQPHRSFEHRGTECVPPITEGRTVKINAGFTSGQRVQKVLSFLMTDKTVNMYLENFIQISDWSKRSGTSKDVTPQIYQDIRD